MGNSVSKTKYFSVNLRNKINHTLGDRQETSSPHHTLVESEKVQHTPNENRPKSSILQNNNFFNATKTKSSSKKSAPHHRQHRQHASIKNTTLSRKKPRSKKKGLVTKSIIGKPTNFKACHITCSKGFTNDLEAPDTESTTMAAQMIALATLIKPLPDMDPNKTLKAPVIPPRTSSYGNHIYVKQIGPTLPSPPSSTMMQHDIPSVSKKSKKKSKNNSTNYPSIKKGKKTNIKYASIGKGSIARKQIQHDKMPRQKRKTIKLEETVNSLNL